MRRREFVVSLGIATIGRPLSARAQQIVRVSRIGVLSPGPKDTEDSRAFFDELARLGYTEERNLSVLFEEYGEHPDRLPELAAVLARAPVDLIVAAGSPDVVRAARSETDRIPIVMIAINYDPIAQGYAESLAHPGGNLTGVYFRSLELVAKQIELLRVMVPQASRLAVLWGAETQDEFASAQASAKAQGWAIRSVELGAPPHDFDAIFRKISAEAPVVLVLSTPAFASHQREVAATALRNRLPAMFRFRSYVEAGGLMSYGVDNPALRRLAARYVVRILAGAKPAELPIERADKFELIINKKTAAALGLTIPPLLLVRADEVVE